MTMLRQLFCRKSSVVISQDFFLGLWCFLLAEPVVLIAHSLWFSARTGFLESCIIATWLQTEHQDDCRNTFCQPIYSYCFILKLFLLFWFTEAALSVTQFSAYHRYPTVSLFVKEFVIVGRFTLSYKWTCFICLQ